MLGNDTDVEGDTLAVTGHSTPAHGTVSCTTTTCTYTPAANYNGADSFTYTISDGHGGTDTATVSMTVTAVQDAPDAVNDSLGTSKDVAKTIAVTSNDTDPDGDTLAVTDHSTPAHGTVSCDSTTCTYTPASGYTGPDSFTYTISDGHGGTDTATVSVTVAVLTCRAAAPTIGTASPGAKRGRVTATARWLAPTNACAAPLTGFVVTATKLNKRGKVVLTRYFTTGPAARSLEMKLPGRRRWTFQVTAVNALGRGTISARSNIVVAR